MRLLVCTLMALCLASPMTSAHESGGYSHDAMRKTNHPNWMSRLKDSAKLSELSIPGTHDSLSDNGNPYYKTQAMSVTNQLKSGIRFFDIRCNHINRACKIFHGDRDMGHTLDDVLRDMGDFLDKNRGEFLLARIKYPETTDDNRKPTEDRGNRGRSFDDTMQSYINRFDRIATDLPYPGGDESRPRDPRVRDLRGKIVLIDDISSNRYWGMKWSSEFKIQDKWKLWGVTDLYKKWKKVKDHLEAARKRRGDGKIWINFLSGASAGAPHVVYPYFVASGHSSKGTKAPRLATGKTTPGWKDWRDFPRVDCVGKLCTIAYEGTNNLTTQYLRARNVKRRIGIIVADFPGPNLIDMIIRQNKDNWK